MIPDIAQADALIAAKQLSPVELTQACLDRVAKLDPVLHAFLLPTPERAMAEARAAEARQMAGTRLGPLDGIPIAHKDIYNTKGLRTTAHSRLLEEFVPEADGTVVRQWADAGSVMLGKLSTHEFAIGGPSFDLPWPPARNPWNADYFTSGSSSGTGAAVAAGMILGGTGSDTGGSIRGPAAFCGIAGIKTTYGLCSRSGVQPLTYSMDHTGPMGWTVEDCAILLNAMAGHDPADPASANQPRVDYRADLHAGVKGLRVAVLRDFHTRAHVVEPYVQAAIDQAEAVLRDAGAEIVEIVLPDMWDFAACGGVILISEAYALHEPWMKTRRRDYGELLRDRMVFGALYSGTDYIQALRMRRELCAAVSRAMENVDVLLTAGAAGEAPRIDAVAKWGSLEKPSFTIPFNVTGQPAITVGAGFGPNGMPLEIPTSMFCGLPVSVATLPTFAAVHSAMR